MGIRKIRNEEEKSIWIIKLQLQYTHICWLMKKKQKRRERKKPNCCFVWLWIQFEFIFDLLDANRAPSEMNVCERFSSALSFHLINYSHLFCFIYILCGKWSAACANDTRFTVVFFLASSSEILVASKGWQTKVSTRQTFRMLQPNTDSQFVFINTFGCRSLTV